MVDARAEVDTSVIDPPGPVNTALPDTGSDWVEVEKVTVAPVALIVPWPRVVPLPAPSMEPVTLEAPKSILTLPL